MVNTHGIGRVGMLAVGLGIGAAVAHSPIAAADTSGDVNGWLAALDPSAAASVPSETNFAISFDGMNLIEAGSATATTESGGYGLAIAIGDHATAVSQGGMYDNAFADGSYALAKAGSTADGATGSDYNTAVDIGNNPSTYLGAPDGAYAGGASLVGNSDSGTNSDDVAIDIGNNGVDPNPSNYADGYTGALAGDGNMINQTGTGNGDVAINIGNDSGSSDHAAAVAGDNNFASEFGSLVGQGVGPVARSGNDNIAIADANYTSIQGVFAGDGNNNYAFADGPDNGNASAGGSDISDPGNNDIAYILDPFNPSDSASQAVAGVYGGSVSSNDLAAVLFTHGVVNVGEANMLYEIVTALGTLESNSLAASAEAAAGWLGLL